MTYLRIKRLSPFYSKPPDTPPPRKHFPDQWLYDRLSEEFKENMILARFEFPIVIEDTEHTSYPFLWRYDFTNIHYVAASIHGKGYIYDKKYQSDEPEYRR